MSYTDARLVTSALAGDPRSVEELVLKYQRRAYAVARAIGLNAAEPDDIVQEAFLQAISKLRTLRAPERFGAWFLQIVRNTARRQIRTPLAVTLTPDLDGTASRETNPVEVKEIEEGLWRAVKKLPESVREAIFLYYYEGESVRSVAAATEVSADVVKKRLQRGRELLRRALWHQFERTVREAIPSADDWTRRGRRLALMLLAAPVSGAAFSCLAPTVV